MTPEFQTELFATEWIAASRRVPRSKQKLMIVLHGKGDSKASYRSIKGELRLPHMNYLLLEAPKRYLGGYSWFALEPRHEKGIKGIRSRLFELVEELKQDGWAAQDLYFLGHSQGCLLACDLVLNHPDSFGGLIGVSGYVWFFKGWRQTVRRSGALRTPWLMTHGTRDRVIEPKEIREDIAELSSGSVDVLYREFAKGHDFDYDFEVPFIRKWIQERHSVTRGFKTELRSNRRNVLKKPVQQPPRDISLTYP